LKLLVLYVSAGLRHRVPMVVGKMAQQQDSSRLSRADSHSTDKLYNTCTVEHYFLLHHNFTIFCVENSLHFNLADTENKYFTIKIPIILLFTFHHEYCISHPGNVDVLCRIVLAMGHSGNSRVINFAILLKIVKIRCMRNIHVLQ